jgi:hypothetical protein
MCTTRASLKAAICVSFIQDALIIEMNIEYMNLIILLISSRIALRNLDDKQALKLMIRKCLIRFF